MKRTPILRPSIAVAAICTAYVFPQFATHGADLILRSQASPRTRIVRLRDIAEFQDASDQEVLRLGNLPLMPAPAPGSQHEVSASDVRDWLAMMGEDLTQIRMSGAPRVVLGFGLEALSPNTNSKGLIAQAAKPDDNESVFRALIERHQSKSSPANRQRLEEDLKEAILLHVRHATRDELPWEIELQRPSEIHDQLAAAVTPLTVSGGQSPWNGSQRFVVRFSSQRGEEHVELDAQLIKPAAVIVARRPIDRNKVVIRADVELKYVPASQRPPSGHPTTDNIDDVLGMVSTRSIPEGEVVYLSSLRPPRLVRRGDRVTAISRGGGFKVRTFAKSKRDGTQGDIIEVESLDTGQSYFAKVVGPGQVAVFSAVSVPNSDVAVGQLSTTK